MCPPRPRRPQCGDCVAGARVHRGDVHLLFVPADPKWELFRADTRMTAWIATCGFVRQSRTAHARIDDVFASL